MADELQASIAAKEWFRERLSETTPDEMMGWSVRQAYFSFENRMNELRESVAAEVKRREQDKLRPRSLVEAGRHITRQEQRYIELQIQKFQAATKERIRLAQEQLEKLGLPESEHEDQSSLPAIPPELVSQISFLALGPTSFSDLTDEYLGSITPAGMQYAEAYLALQIAPAVPNVLFDALLPAAVAEFESLIASLMRIALRVRPHAMSMDSKQLSLGEVRAAQSVAVADILVMVRVVEDFMYNDIGKIAADISKWPGLDMREHTLDWDQLVEAFQRRNVIVHNGGRVDPKYLANLPESIPRPALGDRLNVDADYLKETLDIMTAVGGGLACLWLNKVKGSKTGQVFMSSVVSSLLDRQRWADAELLIGHFLEVIDEPEVEGILTVNRWMAHREELGSLDGIIEDIKAWKPPDEEPEWEVARYALLGDFRETEKRLRAAIRAGRPPHYFASWPLIKQMGRRHPDIVHLVQGRRT